MADALTVLNTISTVIKAAVDLTPVVIKTVEDATPFAQAIYNYLIKGEEITQEDLNILIERLKDLSDQLQKPLPPEA